MVLPRPPCNKNETRSPVFPASDENPLENHPPETDPPERRVEQDELIDVIVPVIVPKHITHLGTLLGRRKAAIFQPLAGLEILPSSQETVGQVRDARNQRLAQYNAHREEIDQRALERYRAEAEIAQRARERERAEAWGTDGGIRQMLGGAEQGWCGCQ